MARHGIVALLAATILGVGVNASPCKPYSSAALSSTITVEPTATGSSTITADVTDTTNALETTVTANTEATGTTEVLETTVTESATETTGGLETTAPETTAAGTTDLVETTTTEVAIDTTGALEITTIETTAADTTNVLEPTTTEAAVETSATAAEPVCVPTQILENTGFDDNNDGSPWALDTGATISQVNPRSAPNFVYATVSQARTFTSIVQVLPALGPFTYQLQYSFNLQTAINGRGFSCQVYPSVNQQRLDASEVLTDSGPNGFRTGSNDFVPQDPDSPVSLSLAVQCLGNYNTIIIGLDDVTLTRTCNVRD